MKLKIKLSEGVKEVIRLYRESTSNNKDHVNAQHSIEVTDVKKNGFFANLFGLNQQGNIVNLEVPSNNHLNELSPHTEYDNDKAKLAKVYATCLIYIHGNQLRPFGKADLENINHEKVLSAMLIAHLCDKLTDSSHQPSDLLTKITNFCNNLLNNKQILQTNNTHDDGIISFQSTLVNIINTISDESNDKKKKIY